MDRDDHGPTRPGTYPKDATRPKQAPRPERPAPGPDGPDMRGVHTVVLRPALFVDLSTEQEQVATMALAELLVPLLTDPGRSAPGPSVPVSGVAIQVADVVAPVVDT